MSTLTSNESVQSVIIEFLPVSPETMWSIVKGWNEIVEIKTVAVDAIGIGIKYTNLNKELLIKVFPMSIIKSISIKQSEE